MRSVRKLSKRCPQDPFVKVLTPILGRYLYFYRFCIMQDPLDVVIVCAVRTPIGKAKRGVFAHTCADDLLATGKT